MCRALMEAEREDVTAEAVGGGQEHGPTAVRGDPPSLALDGDHGRHADPSLHFSGSDPAAAGERTPEQRHSTTLHSHTFFLFKTIASPSPKRSKRRRRRARVPPRAGPSRRRQGGGCTVASVKASIEESKDVGAARKHEARRSAVLHRNTETRGLLRARHSSVSCPLPE